jgi:protein O-GlcNAc transferase
MATISEAMAVALRYHREGRLQAAEQTCRQILAVDPNQADAWHLLGVIALQSGKHEGAVECIGRAISLKGNVAAFHNNQGEAYRALHKIPQAAACYSRALQLQPGYAEAHSNMGAAFKEQGNLDEAVACYRRALQLKPDLAEAHNNLGAAFKEQGNVDGAVASYRRALELKPDYADALGNLFAAFKEQGKWDEAIACCRRAIASKPDSAEAHIYLGNALKEERKLDEAIACYRRAAELKPDYALAHSNLGIALREQGRLEDAVACYRRALELAPDYASAHFNLGCVYKELGKLDDAVACYRSALKARPEYAEALCNLGSAVKDQGNLDEALACFRRAAELGGGKAGSGEHGAGSPEGTRQGATQRVPGDFLSPCRVPSGWLPAPCFSAAESNLLYTQMFSPDYDARTIFEEHRRWNRRRAEPLAKFIEPHSNDRTANRRLRVGYLSPDFRLHPIGRFLLPLLESHDHANVEIFCYASQNVSDRITERCQASADVWRNVFDLSDEQLAGAVRGDRIDILVDLTMHMAMNRLLVFARKPAPVQVTYLAYPGTTGLETMDYRLTDPYLDPPDETEFYSEQSIWLPETYWCYLPVDQTPPAGELPSLLAGHVTFGCLNNFCKVTPPTLSAWSRLLQAAPGARLVLHAHAGGHRDRVQEFFAQQGVSRERVSFVPVLSPADYFRIYQQIDVALDPFPFGGGTTTCDALWMGVPVVSLAGRTAVGRGGLSILSNLGLNDLVARDSGEYVQKALDLASDAQRLIELRRTLRQRMQNSPLMDAPRFARNVEAAYRAMWRRWCGQ